MTALVETLQQHLTPSTIQQISASIGADPASTSSAISMALPALITSLSHNASTPQGAAALDQALTAHDGSVLDNLGGLLGGGVTGSIGGAILGHILGSKQGQVEEGVGKAAGLNTQQVAKLLMMLAPIVMGVLGRAKQQSGMSASQLPGVLEQSSQQMQAQSPIPGGLGGMLDANHDGKITDDLLRAGESALGNLFRKK